MIPKELKLEILTKMLYFINQGITVGFCSAFEFTFQHQLFSDTALISKIRTELNSILQTDPSGVRLERKMLQIIPELAIYKPMNNTGYESHFSGLWFSPEYRNKDRICILETIIKQLET